MSDSGGPTVPMVNEPSNWSLGGRGLGIVARLSLRWGVCIGDDHWGGGDPGTDDGQMRDSNAGDGHVLDGDMHVGAVDIGVDGLDGAHGDCRGYADAGETTVWAEVPVRYGSPAGLVIASSRDA